MICDFARIVTSFFAATPMPNSPSEASLTLVKNRAAQSTIVIADAATDGAKEAAGVLQSYIERITGAELPIYTEDEDIAGAQILVGHCEAVTALSITPPSGVTSQMNEEGFVIKRVGNDLAIAGNED